MFMCRQFLLSLNAPLPGGNPSPINLSQEGAGFAPGVLEELGRRAWQGNARELQNFVRRVVMFSPREVIGLEEVVRAGGPNCGPGDRSRQIPGRLAPAPGKFEGEKSR